MPHQGQIIQRHCMIQGHKEELIVMRCTFKGCQQPKQWMCLVCIELHQDHIKMCLRLEEFAKLLKTDMEIHMFEQRKQIQADIIQKLARQKKLILQCFQKIQQSTQAWFTKLENDENKIQERYQRIQASNPLELTEQEITEIQNQFYFKEAKDLKERQAQLCASFNAQIDKISKSLQQFVDLKHGTFTELLDYNNQYFQCVGKYNVGVKFDQWSILNRNGEVIGGGQYNSFGRKNGPWIDIQLTEVSSFDYIQHVGTYQDGLKIDGWEFKDEQGNKIGGGQFNKSGSKHGLWIDFELCPCGLDSNRYIQHIGKYKEGIKIEQWDTKDSKGNKIGGGQFNKSGSKHGQWVDIELGQSSDYLNYIQHIGKYQDGKRIDQWVVKDSVGEKLGGGQYNQSGNKHELWEDVQIGQSYNRHYILHIGKYKDGKQIDQWETKDHEGKIIGGGLYNSYGSKHERWVEIEQSKSLYQYRNYAKHIGLYQVGVKVGQWQIIDTEGKSIGGGQYNQSGNKQGQWMDVELGLSLNYLNYVQHIGNYQEGKRIDKWEIKDWKSGTIGGGQYNLNGSKHGVWVDVELGVSSNQINYVQHIGKYEDGIKTDKWETKNPEGKSIGGGQYNSTGSKQDQWVCVELGQSLHYRHYLQHIGKFRDDRKIDHWEIKVPEGKIIGGGLFNQNGSKQGNWVDVELGLSLNFLNYIQHIGKYQDGKKVDRWEIKDTDGKLIGGGIYNTFGSKHGPWIDIKLRNSYMHLNFVQHIGKYQDGKKIDQWEVKDREGKTNILVSR